MSRDLMLEVSMEYADQCEDTIVELGVASVETKGQALTEVDVGGGHLRYIAGISND